MLRLKKKKTKTKKELGQCTAQHSKGRAEKERKRYRERWVY